MESVIARHKGLLERLLASPSIPFDGDLHGALPIEGGVYRIHEKGADWQRSIYVGKSGCLHERIYRNHLMGNLESSTLKRKLINSGLCRNEADAKQHLKDQCSVQVLTTDHIVDSEITWFEHFALAILRPRFND